MTFTTLTFVLFVAVVFAVYWALRERRAQNVLLLVASYAFYGWWDWRLSGLIALSSAVDYIAGRVMHASDDPTRRKLALTGSIVTNLGLLGVFKYYGFFVGTLTAAFATVGVELHPTTLHLVLPVGISFYTFQTLGTTIDVYRGRLPACRSALSYFAYVAFFPQLVAGPIERGGRLLPQFDNPRRFDADRASDGLRLMLWGLVQKVALADNLAALVDGCYDGTCSGPVLAVNTVAFAFQIYWDFAGYSNIAVGCAALFGFSLSRNFASPYFSRSVAEFWRRWHITLSTWFRDYVYVSLGGNRRGRVRQAVNVIVTFGVSGLWHGASWNFVVWGLLNGVLAVPGVLAGASRAGPDDVPGTDRAWPGLGDAAAMLRTFALICVGWVFFRAPNLGEALAIVARIGSEVWSAAHWANLAAVDGQLRAMGSLLAIGVIVEWLQRRQRHVMVVDAWPRWARWSLYTVLGWSTLYLTRDDPTRFIYFQF